jgi:hypothetical protein
MTYILHRRFTAGSPIGNRLRMFYPAASEFLILGEESNPK